MPGRATIEHADALLELGAVYGPVATHRSKGLNSFWKARPHDPPMLRLIRTNINAVTGSGTLDAPIDRQFPRTLRGRTPAPMMRMQQ